MSTDQYLHENRAWNWQWPANGNQWNTRLPVTKRPKNSHKCNFTPLPGCANKRHLHRQRAVTGNARRARAN